MIPSLHGRRRLTVGVIWGFEANGEDLRGFRVGDDGLTGD